LVEKLHRRGALVARLVQLSDSEHLELKIASSYPRRRVCKLEFVDCNAVSCDFIFHSFFLNLRRKNDPKMYIFEQRGRLQNSDFYNFVPGAIQNSRVMASPFFLPSSVTRRYVKKAPSFADISLKIIIIKFISTKKEFLPKEINVQNLGI
jgi:hypothetical protein